MELFYLLFNLPFQYTLVQCCEWHVNKYAFLMFEGGEESFLTFSERSSLTWKTLITRNCFCKLIRKVHV